MAKAKAGGTRSYLRGRIASDVYSVGKDGKGKKQQVVRSLAEQVANPQTTAQMAQRMRLASVSELAKALRHFVDHSFDGVAQGQPSVSEFTRRALAAYKADSELASPVFGYLKYGSKNYPTSGVQVSDGKAVIPFNWGESNRNTYDNGYARVGFVFADKVFTPDYGDHPSYPEDNYTVGDMIKGIFGGSRDNYVTFISIGHLGQNGDGKPCLWYIRMKVKDSVTESTVMEGESVLTDFLDVETNVPGLRSIFAWGTMASNDVNPGFSFYTNDDAAKMVANGACCILSVKKNGGYIHSRSFMQTQFYHESVVDKNYPLSNKWQDYAKVDADYATALATYPVGDERFLNGGEL